MKNLKSICLSLFVLCFFLSCTERQYDSNRLNTSPQAPYAEEANYFETSDILYGKRGGGDMIDRMYKAVLNENKQLNELNASSEKVLDANSEAAQPYNEYVRFNETFIDTYAKYLKTIQDTSIQTAVASILSANEKAYKAGLNAPKSKLSKIEAKSIELKDRMTALKLLVVLKEMQAYQKEEYPDIEALNKTIQALDAQIEDVKAFDAAKSGN